MHFEKPCSASHAGQQMAPMHESDQAGEGAALACRTCSRCQEMASPSLSASVASTSRLEPASASLMLPMCLSARACADACLGTGGRISWLELTQGPRRPPDGPLAGPPGRPTAWQSPCPGPQSLPWAPGPARARGWPAPAPVAPQGLLGGSSPGVAQLTRKGLPHSLLPGSLGSSWLWRDSRRPPAGRQPVQPGGLQQLPTLPAWWHAMLALQDGWLRAASVPSCISQLPALRATTGLHSSRRLEQSTPSISALGAWLRSASGHSSPSGLGTHSGGSCPRGVWMARR